MYNFIKTHKGNLCVEFCYFDTANWQFEACVHYHLLCTLRSFSTTLEPK